MRRAYADRPRPRLWCRPPHASGRTGENPETVAGCTMSRARRQTGWLAACPNTTPSSPSPASSGRSRSRRPRSPASRRAATSTRRRRTTTRCQATGAQTICRATGSPTRTRSPTRRLLPRRSRSSTRATSRSSSSRRYDADGNFVERVIRERWTNALWSNPLNGNTIPYTQRGNITDRATRAGRPRLDRRDAVGENIYTDPVTHKKVLRAPGAPSSAPTARSRPAPASSRSSSCSSSATSSVFDARLRRAGALAAGPGTMAPMPWTVLIVDDHQGFRQGARALLEADGFDVLGEAADGESAVEQARRLRPQVVLLDVAAAGHRRLRGGGDASPRSRPRRPSCSSRAAAGAPTARSWRRRRRAGSSRRRSSPGSA